MIKLWNFKDSSSG